MAEGAQPTQARTVVSTLMFPTPFAQRFHLGLAVLKLLGRHRNWFVLPCFRRGT